MFDQARARQWLEILHGDAPGLIHICATKDWAGRRFPVSQIEAAASYASSLDASGNREGVYVRMTTLRGSTPGAGRGTIQDTMALSALWADVDFAGPGHAEANLPPDEAAARACVASSGLPAPTLWIHSGGGLYPIWLLDRPHVVDDDLADLADLSANWQAAIGAGAESLGWHYGVGVGDLARVLRMPGSINRKAGLAQPCDIIEADGRRFSLHELYSLAADALGQVVTATAASAPAAGTAGYGANVDVTPGDDFATRTDWSAILTPHGWTEVGQEKNGVRYWCRPGKAHAISATTNAMGTDRLRVFTTSTNFDTCGYSKLGALAVLEHHGDMRLAAQALKARGFGTQRNAPTDLRHVHEATTHATTAESMTAQSTVEDEKFLEQLHFEQEVTAEMRKQRIRLTARDRIREQDSAKVWREPYGGLLRDELAKPPAPIAFRVDRLLPAGGNGLLLAQFKAGKTTLCGNLLRSIVDGEPFLDRFKIAVPDGSVAFWNYEVSADQFREQMRALNITNVDGAHVLNLRGFSVPLTLPDIEQWAVRWLQAREVRVWIVDPFARAFAGGDENDNSLVGAFLNSLDIIKERAEIGELLLTTHTGRAEQGQGHERARGATRLDDWPDARWMLTADDSGRRFLRAHGRDVDVAEELLTFDSWSGRLIMGGPSRRGLKATDGAEDVVHFVAAHPGLGVNEIVTGMGRNKSAVVAALQVAISDNRIFVHIEARGKRAHFPPGAYPDSEG